MRNVFTLGDSELTKDMRVEVLFNKIEEWTKREELIKLVHLFAGDEVTDRLGENLGENIRLLSEFAGANWDFRQGQERWKVEISQFVEANSEFILTCCKGLGMIGVDEVSLDADVILPLGGARLANLYRCQKAKSIHDSTLNHANVAALSGLRPLAEVELEYTCTYAPEAKTEFDAISAAIETVFEADMCQETVNDNMNPNLVSCVREYRTRGNTRIISLAAPSSNPDRRANSVDTFRYYLEQANVGQGDKLLLVTSSIYVPFQTLRFLDLAIEYGFEVDAIGSETADTRKFSSPANYLQEIKAALDAIYSMYQTYF